MKKIIMTGSEEAGTACLLTAAATLRNAVTGCFTPVFLTAGPPPSTALRPEENALGNQPNYLLFVHPLHLFCLPCMLNSAKKRKEAAICWQTL